MLFEVGKLRRIGNNFSRCHGGPDVMFGNPGGVDQFEGFASVGDRRDFAASREIGFDSPGIGRIADIDTPEESALRFDRSVETIRLARTCAHPSASDHLKSDLFGLIRAQRQEFPFCQHAAKVRTAIVLE
jgi:hypothetical protein